MTLTQAQSRLRKAQNESYEALADLYRRKGYGIRYEGRMADKRYAASIAKVMRAEAALMEAGG